MHSRTALASSGVIYAETAYDQTIVSCQWKKEKEK